RCACVFTSAAVSGTNTTLDCSRTNGIDQTYHPITNRAGRSLIASKARNGFLKEKEICQAKGSPCRHLERRFPVSRLERCPACHPERNARTPCTSRQSVPEPQGDLYTPNTSTLTSSLSL